MDQRVEEDLALDPRVNRAPSQGGRGHKQGAAAEAARLWPRRASIRARPCAQPGRARPEARGRRRGGEVVAAAALAPRPEARRRLEGGALVSGSGAVLPWASARRGPGPMRRVDAKTLRLSPSGGAVHLGQLPGYPDEGTFASPRPGGGREEGLPP